MSVKVDQITKIYGSQTAVNNISFEAGPGKIVGFLGPNGAGKSTTMKMLTCFIPPTSGTASICGFDINNQSMEVRKSIGYLPENNPLYLDMYVKEYLNFVAGLQKMESPENRIKEMISQTGLVKEQFKKIGQLSKGYRQRVGLAQAMLHNPPVLILDEPTSGLDPNQLLEIRKLIKNLGKEKTVILSTHIMQEVEAVCDQVVIINKGELVANEDTKNLLKRNFDNPIYSLEFDLGISKTMLMNVDGIISAEQQTANKWIVSTNPKLDVRKNIFEFAVKNNLIMLSIQKEEENLEEVFRKLTENK